MEQEIERLRHDIERHIAIASEHATECERLRAELANIANAKRFDRNIFCDDTEFADWARNRARHALAAKGE